MTSFPHNLVLDSQPCFGLTKSEFLNLYNFLMNKRIFMKLVAKCSAFVSISYQVHVKVCNPIPLNFAVNKEFVGFGLFLFVCLVKALRAHQQFFSHVGTFSWVEPVLSNENECLAQGYNTATLVKFEPATLHSTN